jgi:hypothetical protein
MEKVVGSKFRNDRPSYQEIMDFTKNQHRLFDDETIPCFCGD